MIVDIGSFQDAYESAMAVFNAAGITEHRDLERIGRRWCKDGEPFTGWVRLPDPAVLYHYIDSFNESDGLLPCTICRTCLWWNRGNLCRHWPHGPCQLYADGRTYWALHGESFTLSRYLELVDLPFEEKVMLKLRWG